MAEFLDFRSWSYPYEKQTAPASLLGYAEHHGYGFNSGLSSLEHGEVMYCWLSWTGRSAERQGLDSSATDYYSQYNALPPPLTTRTRGHPRRLHEPGSFLIAQSGWKGSRRCWVGTGQRRFVW